MNRRAFLQTASGAATAVSAPPALAAMAPQKSISEAPGLVPVRRDSAGSWMMAEARRMGWFQLRFTDAQGNPLEFVTAAADLGMNAICLTFGGSFAFYPSNIEFHQWAPGITADRDFMGTLVAESRKRNIRIGARFDFMNIS